MHSRLVLSLLVASALAFACGPLTRSAATEPAVERAAADTTMDDLASSLAVRVGERVAFDLTTTNVGPHRQELTFPGGQTHELVVVDATGREVWRWSRGRLFTQTMQTRLLGSGESASYSESWTPGEARGSFTVVARLRSDNHPLELRRGFTID